MWCGVMCERNAIIFTMKMHVLKINLLTRLLLMLTDSVFERKSHSKSFNRPFKVEKTSTSHEQPNVTI